MNTWKIFYDDGTTAVGSVEFPDEIWGVQVILHNPVGAGWVTEYGGDFYMLENDRWFGLRREGLVHRLRKKGLMRPKIGTVHEVLEDGEWITIDEIGLYTWIDKNKIALIGTIVADDEFGELMGLVLKEMNKAKETGKLPD